MDNTTLSEMTADNVSFAVDLLYRDCAPLQFLREFTQNGIESINKTNGDGKVIWTFDPIWKKKNGSFKLCAIDTGSGMTGREIVQFINKIFSSGKELGIGKNHGVGAKISAAPLNPRGIEYWSWKDGVGYLAVLRKIGEKYGLEEFIDKSGSRTDFLEIDNEFKPKEIDNNGVKIVLLGQDDEDDTYFNRDAPMPSKWVLRYLNSRYLDVPENVEIWAPAISTKSDGTPKMVRRRVQGTRKFLDKHIENDDHYGAIEVTGATLHWWLMDEKEKRDGVTDHDYLARSGAVFQDELYDMATKRSHKSRCHKFGLLYTSNRVTIVAEPHSEVEANTGRSEIRIGSFEKLPWRIWGRQFQLNMPEPIRELEAEMASKTMIDIDNETKKRLRDWLEDFSLSRYQHQSDGELDADIQDLFANNPGQSYGGNSETEGDEENTQADSKPRNPYSDYLKDNKKKANRVDKKDPFPEVAWLTIDNGGREEGDELEDKAASFIPELNVININGDFRGYHDTVNRQDKQKGDGTLERRKSIERYVQREWRFVLLETVMRVLTELKDNAQWSRSQIENNALTPVGLTTAVMSSFHLNFMLSLNMNKWLGAVDRGDLDIDNDDSVFSFQFVNA